VLARLEDWAGGELQSFATERDALRQSLVKRAQQVAQALRRHSAASLLWSAYATPRLPGVEGAPGLFGAGSLAAFATILNGETAVAIETVPDARLFDLPAVVATLRCEALA
jgi:hypothetical protein